MTGAAFTELVKDIALNGLREDIWTFDGKIIDGRNRYNACLQASVTPRFRTWDGNGSLVEFVISLNLHRRHLSESQRAMVAAKIANLEEGNPHRELTQSIDGVKIGQNEAATMLKVSTASVGRAKLIQKKGVPELVEAVERGEVSVSAANIVADHLPPDRQREVIAKGKGEIVAEARRIVPSPPSPNRNPRDEEKPMTGGIRVRRIHAMIRDLVKLVSRPHHQFPFVQIQMKSKELEEAFSKAFKLESKEFS